jgi:hypothetical protein
MALLALPSGKVWSAKDLQDEKYLRVALLLLYNREHGVDFLHIGLAINSPAI